MNLRKSIQFCSLGGYRRFTVPWWNDILWYLTGLSGYGMSCPAVGVPGWCLDIYTYWHRARYGWAPRDTWSLDNHLNHVLAGTLGHLADHTHGCSFQYFDESATDNECHKWELTLRQWANAFNEDPDDVTVYDRTNNYAEHAAEEDRRRVNIHTALKEIEPVWENLWN